MQKQFYMYIRGQAMPVPAEIHRAYWRMAKYEQLEKYKDEQKRPAIESINEKSDQRDCLIYVNDEPVAVTPEVYRAYWQETERERYLEQRDDAQGTFSYHSFDTEEASGEEMIPSSDISNPVEAEVMERFSKPQLYAAIARLSEHEQMLIGELFFAQKSQSQVATELNISQPAVFKQAHKALKKLEKYPME